MKRFLKFLVVPMLVVSSSWLQLFLSLLMRDLLVRRILLSFRTQTLRQTTLVTTQVALHRGQR